LLLKERNHYLVSGEDNVTDFVFADNAGQVFNHLFGMLVVGVLGSSLVAGL
jgi:hypothetical protein